MTLFTSLFYRRMQPSLLSPTYLTRRHLINFPTPKKEFVFGNFSPIFTTIGSLEKHGSSQHPFLNFFCPRSWLDDIHPYYLNEAWGQTKEGLPKVARDIFNDMYPHHDPTALMTWEQIQKVRHAGLYLLENHYKIPVYYGEPKVKKLENDQFKIEVDGVQTHQVDGDFHSYVWYKIPRLLKLDGMLQRSSVEIYKYSPDYFPNDANIILLGGGLSAVWIAKHFANKDSQRKVICLIEPDKKLNTNVPANREVDYNRIIKLNSKTAKIKVDPKYPYCVEVYCPETKQTYRGPFFTATGIEVPMENFKGIPESQMTTPYQWIESRWRAAKNIPIGSLMESIARLYALTGNLEWAFELHSFYETTQYFETVIRKNFPKELNLDMRYLHALGNAIVNLDNPPGGEISLRNLALNVYKEVYQPTEEKVSLFKQGIPILLDKQLNLFHQEDNLESIMPAEFTPS